MIRGVENVCHAQIIVKPGSTAERMERFILSPACPHLAQFSTIVFLVGTNDMGTPIHLVKHQFIRLFETINGRTQHSTIAFCSILPRPRDHARSRAPIRALNLWLTPACRRNGYHHLNPTKLFRRRDGTPHADLFRDGLHLNDDGTRKLRDFLRSKITELIRL